MRRWSVCQEVILPGLNRHGLFPNEQVYVVLEPTSPFMMHIQVPNDGIKNFLAFLLTHL